MTATVVDARDLFLRRAIRLAPSTDPWADAVAETVMAHYPNAPGFVVDAFAIFSRRYAEQTGKTAPEQIDWPWLWDEFVRQSEMQGDPKGGAA